MSLRAAGEAAKVSFVTVRDIERGDIARPTKDTLLGLAKALDLNFQDLALAVYGEYQEEPASLPNGKRRSGRLTTTT